MEMRKLFNWPYHFLNVKEWQKRLANLSYKKPISTMQESHYLWIFDNGHGGIIDGVYQTAGKRSPKWGDGTQLFEGEFNRSIVNRLVKLCKAKNIEYVNLVDTNEDVLRVYRHHNPQDTIIVGDAHQYLF